MGAFLTSASWVLGPCALIIFLWLLIAQELSFRKGRRLLSAVPEGHWRDEKHEAFIAYQQWQVTNERRSRRTMRINLAVAVIAAVYLLAAIIVLVTS